MARAMISQPPLVAFARRHWPQQNPKTPPERAQKSRQHGASFSAVSGSLKNHIFFKKNTFLCPPAPWPGSLPGMAAWVGGHGLLFGACVHVHNPRPCAAQQAIDGPCCHQPEPRAKLHHTCSVAQSQCLSCQQQQQQRQGVGFA